MKKRKKRKKLDPWNKFERLKNEFVWYVLIFNLLYIIWNFRYFLWNFNFYVLCELVFPKVLNAYAFYVFSFMDSLKYIKLDK